MSVYSLKLPVSVTVVTLILANVKQVCFWSDVIPDNMSDSVHLTVSILPISCGFPVSIVVRDDLTILTWKSHAIAANGQACQKENPNVYQHGQRCTRNSLFFHTKQKRKVGEVDHLCFVIYLCLCFNVLCLT